MSRRKEAIGTRTTTDMRWLDGEPFPSETTKEEPIHKTIYICDWCGKESDNYLLSSDIINDENFECKLVSYSGEGTHLIAFGWQIEDLCMDCVEKFKQLLEDNGIKLSAVDW